MSRIAIGNNDDLTFVTRKRRKQSPDANFYIGIAVEEPISKSRRIKSKKQNVKKCSAQSTRTSNWPAVNEVTCHESPKIWDIFERFQSFSKRKVLTRHKSGLLDSYDDDVAKNISQSKTIFQSTHDNNNIQKGEPVNRRSNSNSVKTEPTSLNEDESSFGGDRKRRCIEVTDYEEELSGKREAQPASAFKPKCLNFDEINDS